MTTNIFQKKRKELELLNKNDGVQEKEEDFVITNFRLKDEIIKNNFFSSPEKHASDPITNKSPEGKRMSKTNRKFIFNSTIDFDKNIKNNEKILKFNNPKYTIKFGLFFSITKYVCGECCCIKREKNKITHF